MTLWVPFAAAALVSAIAPESSIDVPKWDDVQMLEQLRLWEPLAQPTDEPGVYIVQNAPSVETRGLTCVATDQGVYSCAFETRTKPSSANDFGPWESRAETVARDDEGGWRFAH